MVRTIHIASMGILFDTVKLSIFGQRHRLVQCHEKCTCTQHSLEKTSEIFDTMEWKESLLVAGLVINS